jgi:histidinol-phosphatase (PHP family)
MRFPADYHMHTPLCRHAEGEPSAFAAQALAIGMDEIGFSDHSPMWRDDFDDWRMRDDQMDAYVESVGKARRDHPGLRIKLGLEVDYVPGHEDWIRALAARHPWDYLIGSVHYVDEWDIDNPKKLSAWRDRDTWEVWSAYFDRLTQAAGSGFFDIIGHADLAKKFAFRPVQDCTPLYERFLQEARRTDTAIELNTAGLRKDCQEIYPSMQILEKARHIGVAITFGSDAHAPGEVGMGFDHAIALARQAGYATWRELTRRTKKECAL